jgi:ABC-type uncharacterized transport system permease subunit
MAGQKVMIFGQMLIQSLSFPLTGVRRMVRYCIHLEVSVYVLAKFPVFHDVRVDVVSYIQSHLFLGILGMTASNFSWEKYLKDTNSIAAPEHLFKEVSCNWCGF